MKTLLTLLLTWSMAGSTLLAVDPDYSTWTRILKTYYDPVHGMDYRGLRAKELGALEAQRRVLSQIDVWQLTPKERLAYWLNLYNLTTVSLIVGRYPVTSIRDLSTDPFIRLNVFKRTQATTRLGKVSLQDMEDVHLREAFKDPRIHFAINCAARSCPPMRQEAFLGSRVDAQLEDQVRSFLTARRGITFESATRIQLSKIFDWFHKDFQSWPGGIPAFLQRHLPADSAGVIAKAGNTLRIDFDAYDWSLNDWQR